MIWTTAVAGILLLALGTSGNPVEHENYVRGLVDHHDHLMYQANFPCALPQPKVVAINQLLTDDERRGKAHHPDITVLYRCDASTGCCYGQGECGPIKSHTVRLIFKATYMEEVGEHRKSDWQMESHDFNNHTVCGCRHHQPRTDQVQKNYSNEAQGGPDI